MSGAVYLWLLSHVCGALAVAGSKSRRLALQDLKGVPKEFESDLLLQPLDTNEVAVFSMNVGDYRDEIQDEEFMEKMTSLSSFGIDCYFFTDNEKIDSIPGWKVVHVNVTSDVNGIPGSRIAIKNLKFGFHPILSGYKYLIHTDSKPIKLQLAAKTIRNGIIPYARKHPDKAIFLRKHLKRQNVLEEIDHLMEKAGERPLEVGPLDKLEKWKEFLLPEFDTLNKIPLHTLDVWLINTEHKEFVQQWGAIADVLLEHGLYRDQIVYTYVMRNFTSEIKVMPESMDATLD